MKTASCVCGQGGCPICNDCQDTTNCKGKLCDEHNAEEELGSALLRALWRRAQGK